MLSSFVGSYSQAEENMVNIGVVPEGESSASHEAT
jgi:hypothetical protein